MSAITSRSLQPTVADTHWAAVASRAAALYGEVKHDRRPGYIDEIARELIWTLARAGIIIRLADVDDGTFTDRELQVLIGISQGRRNAEIGRQLHMSEETVKTHARSLYRKLGARDRAHAVALGFRMGLVL